MVFIVSLSYGTAYAFFKCNASFAEITSAIPSARREANSPSYLEITITEDPTKINTLNDPELADIAQDAKAQGINYAAQATLLKATNRETAIELREFLNALYAWSGLYTKGEKFFGEVVYDENSNGEYYTLDRSKPAQKG